MSNGKESMKYDVDIALARKVLILNQEEKCLPQPTSDIILLLPEEPGKYEGFQMQVAEEERNQESLTTGIVLVIGPGRYYPESNSRVKPGVSPGDRVLFRSRGRMEVTFRGTVLVLVNEPQVFAIMDKELVQRWTASRMEAGRSLEYVTGMDPDDCVKEKHDA